MASSRSEESEANIATTSRQKRGLSFTGMLRDSLSLLVPTFVLDATTPKRRRVEEELSHRVSSAEDRNNPNQQNFNYVSTNLQVHPSTPTRLDNIMSRQSVPPSITPLYHSLASSCETTSSSEKNSFRDNLVSRHALAPAETVASQNADSQIPTYSLPRESYLANAAKRTRLNDSHVPSSSLSAWTHTSESSSSGSLLGETYHQSSFYNGKIFYGGASNYRRETLRGRLKAGNKRSQSTVVPLRLNSVVPAPVADDLSDVASTSSEGGPILSVATRRILRAMRRGTDNSQDSLGSDVFGTTVRSVRNQRHSLWTSCVRRRGRTTRAQNVPPIVELRPMPQSTHEANNIFSSTSWPRDTIGVPPVNRSVISNHKQDYNLASSEMKSAHTNSDEQTQRSVDVFSSFSFSSPAIRSHPSTRPPSNASSSDISRTNFIFQSPPSRSASSNALFEMATFAKSNPKSSSIADISFDDVNNTETAVKLTASTFGDLKSANFQSNTTSLFQTSSAPILFSGSRTLPEVRPSFDALPVSLSTSQVSPTTCKRALPQEVWRCEACLAENAFLITSCRVCQRGPSIAIAASQREWHSQSSEASSQKHSFSTNVLGVNSSNTKLPSVTNEESSRKSAQKLNDASTLLPATTTNKWRCETCLIENPKIAETCACCQAARPKGITTAVSSTSKLLAVEKNWRCETCLVENKASEEKCVCCMSIKPKTTKSADNLNIQTNKKVKWQCSTCLVENDNVRDKCVCCESLKPKSSNSESKANQLTNSSSSSWRCETCLVENKSSVDNCCCCETPRIKSIDEPKNDSLIKGGGLLSSWKSTTQAKFSFGSFGKEKVSGSDVEAKDFGSNQQSIKFGNPISNVNFGKSISDGSIKFGKPPDHEETNAKSGGFVFGNPADPKKNSAKVGSFIFGSPLPNTDVNRSSKDESCDNERVITNAHTFGNGPDVSKSEFKFGPHESTVNSFEQKIDASSDHGSNGSTVMAITSPQLLEKVSSEKKSNFNFGKETGAKCGENSLTENTSDKENPVKSASVPAKNIFGDGITSVCSFKMGGSNSSFAQMPINTTQSNHKDASFMDNSSRNSVAAPGSSKNVNTAWKNIDSTLETNVTAKEDNRQKVMPQNIFGSSGVTQSSVFMGKMAASPPSTSIESIFANSGPKMTFKKQDTNVLQFGAPSKINDVKMPGGPLFGSVDANKQKRLTSSMSSPTLMSGPNTTSADVGSKISAPSFTFGKVSKSDADKFPSVGFTNDIDKQPGNAFVFGKINNEKTNIFPSQPFGGNTIASNVPPVSFGNANRSSTGGFSTNGPTSNTTSMFPNTQLSSSMGSQQAFVFGASASGNSNALTTAPAPSTTPTPPVPSSFQFGNQTSSQQSLFLFGSNSTSNPTNNATTFGSVTAANPFSSQGSVPATNTNRPIKKAVRRLRK